MLYINNVEALFGRMKWQIAFVPLALGSSRRGSMSSGLKSKMWVLAADRVRARFFEIDPDSHDWVEMATLVNPEGRRPKGSRGDRKPPRSIESVGGAHHAIEPHMTPEEKSMEVFSREISDYLKQAHTGQQFDKLVIAAPPRFLGAIRAELSPSIRELVAQEIHRDLSNLDMHEIASALSQHASH